MNTKLEGLRTFIVTLVAVLALVIGLKLLKEDQRASAFVFFATALVGLAGAQAVKSIGSAAVAGDGLKGGMANLLTDKKPGEPGGP
jgi:threonine dehydrogenase-like Zn-dependent dehydrogenase